MYTQLRFLSINSVRRSLAWRMLLPPSLRPLVLMGILLLVANLTTTAQTYNPNGVTVAGGNGFGNAANQLYYPTGVYVNALGNIYVTDQVNSRIQRWAPGASQGVTVAGGNGYGDAANQLNYPENMFVDPAGSVYVSDGANNRVQRWASGASQGVTVAGGNGGGSDANQLSNPQGLYIDAGGNIYIADYYNNRVQRWAPGASQGITVAGSNVGVGGSNASQLDGPTGVWLDAAGNLYVADIANARIQRWSPGASQGVTVAGGNGYGSAANQLSGPEGLFVDSIGTIYIADRFNDRIQRWTPGASEGVTVAGGNGYGSAANQLDSPQSVFVDPTGTLYVAESGNNRVQRFDPIPTLTGFSVSPNPVCIGQPAQFTATVSNASTYSFTLTNGMGSPLVGTASGSAFNQSLTPTTTGLQTYTLILNTNGGVATATTSLTVAPLPTVSITPSASTVCSGQTVTLSATPGLSRYVWSTGQTTASISVSATGTYSVTGTSSAGCSATATSSVTVNPTPSVSISPSASTVCAGQTVTLSATPGLSSYRWSTGQTTASISVSASGNYTVTATNTSGCSASATASVTVNPTPPTPTLTTASSQPGQLYPGGQSSVTVPQYSGIVTLLINGCTGTINWQGPNGSSGSSTSIPVATSATGTFVYQATCQQNGCPNAVGSATVVVQSGSLTVVAPLFDCATGKLTLRTTGGNGQPIEYQIPSVTNGWQATNPVSIEAKDFKKSLKLRARQRSVEKGGYDSAELDYQLPTCLGARIEVSEEPVAALRITVLGNPVTGQSVSVEVRGAEGQSLQLTLTSLQGRTVSERSIERAGAIETQTLPMSNQTAGLLLLRVSTPTQSQTVKVLKAQ